MLASILSIAMNYRLGVKGRNVDFVGKEFNGKVLDICTLGDVLLNAIAGLSLTLVNGSLNFVSTL
jgi:hypothetical protein